MIARSELYRAVWMHAVHCDFRNKGWPVLREELEEAVEVFRQAEENGQDIPSMAEACDFFNHG